MELAPLLLWAVLMQWGPAETHPDETRAQYRNRVATIVLEAQAVVWERYEDPDTRIAWLATLLALGYEESGAFHWKVHAGIGDGIGDGERARCLGQVHASRLLPRDAWRATTGTDPESTRRCWAAVLRYMRGARGQCGGDQMTLATMSRAFALYGTGNSCEPTKWSVARARRWAKLTNRARRLATN